MNEPISGRCIVGPDDGYPEESEILFTLGPTDVRVYDGTMGDYLTTLKTQGFSLTMEPLPIDD